VSSAPRRILIVRLSHLGDVVHALGVFHALRAEHPTAAIGWAVQREFADLLRGLPGLDRVFELDRTGGLGAWRALRRAIAAWGPDWAVDAQGNVKSAAATWLSGAGRKSGLARGDWRERTGSWLVPDRAARACGPHAMERMRALVQHVAPTYARTPGLRSDPAPTPRELAAARAELARVAAFAPTVLVHLAAPGDVRSWPRERFRELARALPAAGESALLVSGPAETELGRALAAELGPGASLAHWVGQRGLRALAAAMTVLAREGCVFVGCDSGPMHLAWACGLPVVCLSGPQAAHRTGPWPLSGRHAVVRARKEPACAPCFARACSHAEGPVCMTRIEADDVLAGIARAREATAAAAAAAPS
jgi:ADP-heptose:LPS heptosyltransferase